MKPPYEARGSVGLLASGFVTLVGSAGGVNLNPDKADLGTSTAHPAINRLATAKATKAVIEQALYSMTRPPRRNESSVATFFNR
jgi:hypothetical protein